MDQEPLVVKWMETPIVISNSDPSIHKPKAKYKAGGPKPFYEEIVKHRKRRK